jgi:hypothetical protein
LKHVLPNWNALSTAQKFAAVALFAAIVFELTAWVVFPFNGYDSYSHIFWIGEWHKLWQLGIYYPRWLPDGFHGFGAPSFYYYPPLTFFLSSALYLLAPNVSPDAIGKSLGIIAFACSAISMFLYLRWRSAKDPASPSANIGIIFGALLYTFAPYRIFNYATRGAMPEHIAIGLVPFVFWGTDLIMQRRQPNDIRRGATLIACSLALLILANLPAAAVAGIGIVLYVVFQKRQERQTGLKGLLVGAIASLLLTAFYLLPVAAMFGDVQLGRLWRPVPLVQSSPFLAIFTGQALTINSYTFIMLAGACMLLIAWMLNKNIRQPLFWLVVFIIAAQLPLLTQYLYRYIPPFTIVQLASRFSILLLMVMATVWQEELWNDKRRVPIASIVVAFWSICTIVLVGLQLADVHVHKHGPLPVSEASEYATRWARPYYNWGDSLATPFANDFQNIAWPAKDSVSVISSVRKSYSDTIDYSSQTRSQALLRRSYWPAWEATIDGTPTITAPDSLGRLMLSVPEGKHRIILWLETSRSAETGSWISISSLFVLITIWIFAPKIRKTKSPKSSA